jgi:hypothetical protein
MFRLQVTPTFDFGLELFLRESLEIFLGQLSGGRALPCELLPDDGVSGHAPMIPPIWPDVKPLGVGVHFWGATARRAARR